MNSTGDENSSYNNAIKILDDGIGNSLKTCNATQIYESYKDIFEKIREKISNNEEKAQQFIQDLTKYYQLIHILN